MAKALQRRRGTTEEHKSFTGLEGEFTYDTTEKRVVAHDGVTAGGVPMAKKAEVTALEGAIGELAKHNVGEEWVSYTGIVPDGGVPYSGQEVSRATYSALWDWVNANGLIKSEAEWQEINANQNGNVAFYSSGDGSSTFRMPKISGYAKGALSPSEAGSYQSEGLPNITGGIELAHAGAGRTTVGALTVTDHASNTGTRGTGSTVTNKVINLDASGSNSIYGNSEHVTPETVSVLYGVYAFGEVINAGELDAETLAAGLSRVEANVSGIEASLGDLDSSISSVESSLSGVVRSVNDVKADADGNVTLSVSSGTVLQKYSGVVSAKSGSNKTITVSSLDAYKPIFVTMYKTGSADSLSIANVTSVVGTGGTYSDGFTTGMASKQSRSSFVYIPTGTSVAITFSTTSSTSVSHSVTIYQ